MRPIAINVVLLLVFGCFYTTATTANDVGEVAFPNSGAAQAQPSFLHGLALLHDFEYSQAAAEFRKAQKLDPGFAIAYWGEAMTYNHPVWMEQDQDAAIAVLKRLGATREARLLKAGTERERDYLRAAEVLYGDGEKWDRDFAYANAMANLHQKCPDDPNAAAFYALSLLGTAHEGRDFVIYMRAAAVLEEVFHDHPHHPGAVHYLIHCYDDPIHAQLGLRPARVYAKIAPNAAHAQHMTSHIFLALGMWDDVVSANENAVHVVDEQRKEEGKPPSACGHYNYWLEYGYLQQGRPQPAKSLLMKCREVAMASAPEQHQPGMQMLDPDNSNLGSLVQMWARYVLESEGWKGDVAGWTIPLADELNPQITVHWLKGMKSVYLGETDKARQELETMRDLRRKLNSYYADHKEEDTSYINRAEILEMQIQAMLFIAAGKSNEGIDLLGQAAVKEENLPMAFGPPFIDKPSRELLGEELLRIHRSKEAAAAFKAALQRAPGRTNSLRGLKQTESAASSGKSSLPDRSLSYIYCQR